MEKMKEVSGCLAWSANQGWEMDHIRFGWGIWSWVILPDWGRPETVRETALPLAAACRGVRQGAEGLSVQQEAGLSSKPPSA